VGCLSSPKHETRHDWLASADQIQSTHFTYSNNTGEHGWFCIFGVNLIDNRDKDLLALAVSVTRINGCNKKPLVPVVMNLPIYIATGNLPTAFWTKGTQIVATSRIKSPKVLPFENDTCGVVYGNNNLKITSKPVFDQVEVTYEPGKFICVTLVAGKLHKIRLQPGATVTGIVTLQYNQQK
jgi:hypothetical protein